MRYLLIVILLHFSFVQHVGAIGTNSQFRAGISFVLHQGEVSDCMRQALFMGDFDSAFRLYQFYELYQLDASLGGAWLYVSAMSGHEIAKANFSKLCKVRRKDGRVSWTKPVEPDDKWDPGFADVLDKTNRRVWEFQKVSSKEFENLKKVMKKFGATVWEEKGPSERLHISNSFGFEFAGGNDVPVTYFVPKQDLMKKLPTIVYDRTHKIVFIISNKKE